MNSLHEKAVQAILYGHSCTMQLKERLDDPMVDDNSVSSYDLATTIIRCFSNAISILSVEPDSEDDDQISDLSSRKSSPTHFEISHSKKRKVNSTNVSEKWTHDSSDSFNYDQFLWRKYGEKYIKKSGHQRSYFRCSYNKDHNCKARKHEEKIKENPLVYRTTYFGHHTCKINHNQDAYFTPVRDPPVEDLKSGQVINFRNDIDKEEKYSHSSTGSSSVKYEEDKTKKETIGHVLEMTGNDQDCKHVLEENQSSPSLSYPPPSSSGSESIDIDFDLLLDNQGSWDRYGQLYLDCSKFSK